MSKKHRGSVAVAGKRKQIDRPLCRGGSGAVADHREIHMSQRGEDRERWWAQAGKSSHHSQRFGKMMCRGQIARRRVGMSNLKLAACRFSADNLATHAFSAATEWNCNVKRQYLLFQSKRGRFVAGSISLSAIAKFWRASGG